VSGREENLVGAAVEFAGGLYKLWWRAASLPLELLPRQTRRHMHNALEELNYAFVRLPGDFAEIARTDIDSWARSVDAEAEPARYAESETRAGRQVDSWETFAPSATPASDVAASPAVAIGVTIDYIEFDPPGDDLQGEFVRFRNSGTSTMNMTGWTLRDEGAKHMFVFPAFSLAPGADVQLWTKSGTNDAKNLYWNSRRPVWNNTGDTAVLSNATGVEVARYSYEGKK
jgi:hypothetical protein